MNQPEPNTNPLDVNSIVDNLANVEPMETISEGEITAAVKDVMTCALGLLQSSQRYAAALYEMGSLSNKHPEKQPSFAKAMILEGGIIEKALENASGEGVDYATMVGTLGFHGASDTIQQAIGRYVAAEAYKAAQDAASAETNKKG